MKPLQPNVGALIMVRSCTYLIVWIDAPIDNRTTLSRLPVSMYCPTAGARKIADKPRVSAYTDMGISVPGNIVAK